MYGDNVRNHLIEFSGQLRELKFPTSPLSMRLVEYVASSFEKFLSGEAKSLDEAFGLVGVPKKRGRPTQHDQKRDRWLKEYIRLRWHNGMTSEAACNTLAEKGMPESLTELDESSLRRSAEKRKDLIGEVIAEEMAKELAAEREQSKK